MRLSRFSKFGCSAATKLRIYFVVLRLSSWKGLQRQSRLRKLTIVKLHKFRQILVIFEQKPGI